jgi:RES domain-containing protein
LTKGKANCKREGTKLLLSGHGEFCNIMENMGPYKNANALRQLFESVTAQAAGWKGTVYRAVGTEYANRRDLLSGEGTKRCGGRWTPPGSFATVHASLDVKTALAESLGLQQQFGIAVAARLPLTIVAIDGHLQRLVDLTDKAVLAELALTRQRLLRCRWREISDKGREALTQAIGRIAFEAGLEGLIVPSAQARKGKNLVVFPENLAKGSILTIQNAGKLPIGED